MRAVGLYMRAAAWDDTRPLAEQDGIAAHLEYLTGLGARSLVTRGGPFHAGHVLVEEDPVGLIVFASDDLEEARRLVERDPAVERGLMSCRVLPWYL